jgi:two-component system, chemotaxis family, chemotaxis protein CheY
LKVIIAEDEPDIAELYKDALGERGHEVFLATNGKDCFEEYRLRNTYRSVKSRPPFDVVILDYSMPVMDGLEAAKLILKLQPSQRIIFASAYAEDTLLATVKKLRMVVELLQKPFTIDVLVHTVEDRKLFAQLSRLNVDIKQLKEWNPDHSQLELLLETLTRIRRRKPDLNELANSFQEAAPESRSSTIKGFLDHEDPAHHFSIQYPDNWLRIENDVQQAAQNTGAPIFVAKSPEGDAGITVTMQNLPRSGMDLEEYTRISMEALDKKISNFDLIELNGTSIELSGHPAHKVVYTGSLDPLDKNSVSIKIMQIWSIIGNRVCIITYATPPEIFDQYSSAIAQKMIDSVKVDEAIVPKP